MDNQQGPTYNTGHPAQLWAEAWMGENGHMYRCGCLPWLFTETNTTLINGYTPVQSKKFLKLLLGQKTKAYRFLDPLEAHRIRAQGDEALEAE